VSILLSDHKVEIDEKEEPTGEQYREVCILLCGEWLLAWVVWL